MRATKPRLLLDIDGVCANFVASALDAIYQVTGRRRQPEEITGWDIVASLGLSEMESKWLDNCIGHPRFCRDLAPFPGVHEAIAELKELADVYPVTAPFDPTIAPHWVPEREAWIAEHLGIARGKIVQTSVKYLVGGDYLVEDKTSALVQWDQEHPCGEGVLVTRPYNEKDAWGGVRVTGLAGVVALVRSRL